MSDPLPIGDIASNFNANPMVIRHGRGPDGARCRECRHITPTSYRTDRTYWKCKLRGLSHGQGTDHRKKWDACRLFESRELPEVTP